MGEDKGNIEEENKRSSNEEKSDLERLSTCVIIFRKKDTEVSRASRDCHLKFFYIFYHQLDTVNHSEDNSLVQRRTILNVPVCHVSLSQSILLL